MPSLSGAKVAPISGTPLDHQQRPRGDACRDMSATAHPRPRSLNANCLGGQNSASFPEIYATFQGDKFATTFLSHMSRHAVSLCGLCSRDRIWELSETGRT